jgi:protein SCO1
MPSAVGGREIAPRPLSPVRVLAMFSKVRLRRAAIVLVSGFAIAAAAVAVNRASQVNAARQLPQIGGHFALSTPDGRRVTDATFHGKWLLVYFGYTSCPDVCPTTLSAMALALDKLGPLADKVQPVFITVDPERDTSKIVGEYVKDFDPRFVGLVGSPQEIGAAAQEFHVYYRVRQLGNNEYVVDHSSFIYLLDPNGAFVRLLTGDLPGHQLADELRKLMS